MNNKDWLRLREKKGWSQRKLAMKAGMSQTVIHQIEIGYKPPSDEQREKLLIALGVPL